MSQPFWDALREHRILIQYSPSARRYVFYPRTLAPGTLADDLEWREIDGAGTLYTYTVARRPTGPPWADKVPQLLAVVEWDVGPAGQHRTGRRRTARTSESGCGSPRCSATFPTAGSRCCGTGRDRTMFETVQQLLRSRMNDDTVAMVHGDQYVDLARAPRAKPSAEASAL